MNRRQDLHCGCVLALVLTFVSISHAQEKSITPDLAKVMDGKSWKLINAQASTETEDSRRAVHLKVEGDVRTGSTVGLALVEGLEFTEGTIEVDLKGRNKPQGSFLGVAFSVADGKTFEAVYFRPFNFKAEDAQRRGRSVQYIAWPTYTWEKLRKEQPGKYEQPVRPVPDPDGWFRARIEVTKKNVHVYVNDAREPSLVVERLNEREKGQVGLWVDVYDGAFANLKITPAK